MKEKYVSTRGGEKNISASQGIIKGIAKDGGLFVPSFIHDLSLDLASLKDMRYGELAFAVFEKFLDDFSPEQIKACIDAAYYSGKFEGEEPVAISKVADRYFLELYHGPTCAFKDMALTILPHLMTTAMKNIDIDKDIVILTATSGDTGKAALEGFAKVPRISIVVYYPKDGVSTIQEKQMLTQEGENTRVIGVAGNFDDTQNGVKQILNDHGLIEELDAAGYVFSSANSINIGRLLPQVVYYFYSYFALVKNQEINLGDPVNFVVPTGNFGNILAGYYAHILGLPVNRFICASNSNNVLTDFFADGAYNKNRDFHKTISPSMDILISSNLERLLYDLADGNAACIAGLMADLNTKGAYTLPEALAKNKAYEKFYGGCADEMATQVAIHDMFVENHYLMDTHTAVASRVYDDYLAKTGDTTPTIILSTASPYKFGHSVYQSIFGEIPEGLDDYAVLTALSEKTGTEVPKPLRDLDKKANLHDVQCSPQEMADCVKAFLKI
ncbi:MAG: threonine synthase [Eubacterium sp.]|nr:threonine synthase [Eubacterium sp.]